MQWVMRMNCLKTMNTIIFLSGRLYMDKCLPNLSCKSLAHFHRCFKYFLYLSWGKRIIQSAFQFHTTVDGCTPTLSLKFQWKSYSRSSLLLIEFKDTNRPILFRLQMVQQHRSKNYCMVTSSVNFRIRTPKSLWGCRREE